MEHHEVGALAVAVELERDDHVRERDVVTSDLEVAVEIAALACRMELPGGVVARAAELMRETTEYRPRLTDAVLVATAERLGVTRVAAFDRRPIAIFRPKHVRALEMEP